MDPEHLGQSRHGLFPLEPGFLQVQSEARVNSSDCLEYPLGKCLDATIKTDTAAPVSEDILTIFMERGGWKNPYHNLQCFYDAWMISKFLGASPEATNVVWLDEYPESPYQELWLACFRGAQSITEIPRLHYGYAAIARKHFWSPLTNCLSPTPPYWKQFTQSVSDLVDPKVNGSITFVSRENAKLRRLLNREELLDEVRRQLPEVPLRVVHLENLTPLQQIEVARTTRVMVSMHGAGLWNTAFLPAKAGLVEIFPDIFHAFRFTYSNMAKWSGRPYQRVISASRDPKGDCHAPVSKTVQKIVAMCERSV